MSGSRQPIPADAILLMEEILQLYKARPYDRLTALTDGSHVWKAVSVEGNKYSVEIGAAWKPLDDNVIWVYTTVRRNDGKQFQGPGPRFLVNSDGCEIDPETYS
jgi:hypothetical protein